MCMHTHSACSCLSKDHSSVPGLVLHRGTNIVNIEILHQTLKYVLVEPTKLLLKYSIKEENHTNKEDIHDN